MPRICAFYGIVILMYHDEIQHGGRPHFHARWGGNEASFDIETMKVLVGTPPSRMRRLVVKWALTHRPELRANWERARRGERLEPLG